MFGRMKQRTVARDAFVALSCLALAMTLLFPPGLMPGPRWSMPVVICGGHGPLALAIPGRDDDARRQPVRMPTGSNHACPFAASVTTPFVPDFAPVAVVSVTVDAVVRATGPSAAAPGRGMAAPPPPSHAPPVVRA